MNQDPTLPTNALPFLQNGIRGYNLVRCLGQGGNASVWEALDRRSSPVAIKVLPRVLASDRHRAQVEVAALRWLQLPGVVRFFDEGEEEDCFWIAMELVRGSPFPGSQIRLSWEQLAPLALRLLHILGGVHRAGVLHRDLKPSNVFVGEGGRVVLLDFGIASGEALSDLRKDPREGTRMYLAPECRSGAQPNFSTDLYAAGVMFRQVLTGVYDDLAPLPSDLPALVAEMLDRMVAADRRLRPATAEEAALGLGRPPRHWKVAEPLEDLFHGPSHYLHLPERGAERLREQTGGDLSKVPALLHTWEQQGVGHWEGERMVLDRLSVAEWSGREEEDLAQRLQAGQAHATLYRASIELAHRLLDASEVERALRLCERALELGPGSEEVALLAAEAAGRLESAAGLNRAICLLRRCPPSPRLQAVDRLLRAAELAYEGRGADALPMLDWWLAPLPEGIELWRMGTRFLALKGKPGEAEALAEARTWARSPERLAHWKGWKANFISRKQKYMEAAHLHEDAVADRKTLDTRLAAQRAAAAAWMEEGELERAHALAVAVRKGAASLGRPALEALAEWLERSVAWRMDRPPAPDWERIEAAATIGATLGGLLALNDAAIARHQQQRELATALVQRAEELLAGGHVMGAALAGCLRISLAGGEREDAQKLAETLRKGSMPGLLIQGLALLSDRWPGTWAAEITHLLATRPPSRWKDRLEILSFEECRLRCRTL